MTSCASFPASSFSAVPARSWPIPLRKASAFALSVPPPPAAPSLPRTMCRSMIRSADGFTGRSSPSSPSATLSLFAAASATSTDRAPSAAWSTWFPYARRPTRSSSVPQWVAKAPTTTACWQRLIMVRGIFSPPAASSVPTATFRKRQPSAGRSTLPATFTARTHSSSPAADFGNLKLFRARDGFR